MNCEQARVFIGDLVDGYLSAEQEAPIRRHIDCCPSCRRELQEETNLRRMLRELPVPEPSPAFVERALGIARPSHRYTGWFPTGLGAAIAACIAFVVIATMVYGPLRSDITLTMAVDRVRTVNMVFNAPKDLADVAITVVLPEGMELLGFPGRREVDWLAPLHEGKNLLALPVVAHRPTSGILTTYLYYKNDRRTFKVRLDAKGQANLA